MKLLFVGDVMLGRVVNQVLRSEPPAYPWGDTLPIFRQADFRVCNLECVISDAGVPWSVTPKVFHFRSDARNVAALQIAGINAVSLANNHTLDYEYEGMYEMLKTLDGAGIRHAGAGASLPASSAPAFSEVGGQRIGLIAFTDNEPVWEAGENRPGLFYVPIDLEDGRARRLLEEVDKAKGVVELLILSAHWGPNWGYRPPAEHLPFARALIDAGADIIFGHSGHVFRGVELYKGKPIIYCAGDFIDDYAVDEIERNDQSFIFVVEARGGEIRGLRLHPTVITDYQARLARGIEAEEIASRMTRLCRELGTRALWRADQGCLDVVIDCETEAVSETASV